MSLRARSYQRIPTRTVLTAWAACPKGTPAMLMRDRLDVVFEDEEFADLYPKGGRPGLSTGQLALVSVLQFAENLSDRAAANAVRTRIDWKCALGLELDDPGFDHSVLCEFRAQLADGDAADRLLQVMLHRLAEAGLLKCGGRQRTDATHVLAAVRTLSRLELVGESLRAALEQLAQTASDWLVPLVEPEWDKRYGRKVEIGKVPGGKAGATALAEAFGRDGQKILAAAWAADAPPRLRLLAQVEVLRQVWVHHYYWDPRGRLRWRDGHALPPASLRFDSPYDTDAHYCVKRDWQRRYAIRAGIEATLSQNVRTCGLRRTRYRGLAKTHVQHVLTGLACNVTRIADWIADPARPRRAPSHFHALCTTPS